MGLDQHQRSNNFIDNVIVEIEEEEGYNKVVKKW